MAGMLYQAMSAKNTVGHWYERDDWPLVRNIWSIIAAKEMASQPGVATDHNEETVDE